MVSGVAIEVGTLRGRFARLDGTPDGGTVRITPSLPALRARNGSGLYSGSVVVSLDDLGEWEATVPATTAFIESVTYSVRADLDHGRVPVAHGVEVRPDELVDTVPLFAV
jgi:hypothetical protein